MRILVQKFGGTSLRNIEVRSAAVDKITEAHKSGYMPIVIVSAIGRDGDPYATDTLIKFAIQESGGKIEPRENDLLMSCGEVVSSVIMATSLVQRGLKARAVTGWQAGIYTDDCFGDASYYEVDTTRVYSFLENGVIPVITGFQGVTHSGDVTTLGRGGSDTTAAILGAAFKAEAVEIYTDVDGLMTADPRLLPEAEIISDMSYNEVFQMADHGAKVIHSKAVEIAMRSNVPLIIRNTMSNMKGTRISSDLPAAGFNKEDVLSGIVFIGDRAQLRVEKMSSQTEKSLLNALADADISIDLINIFPDRIVVTIDDDKVEACKAIMEKLSLDFEIISGLGKVSAIGVRMRGIPGVMARIIRSLSDADVEVLQTADSHMTISCLIKTCDAEKAVKALHEEFGMGKKK